MQEPQPAQPAAPAPPPSPAVQVQVGPDRSIDAAPSPGTVLQGFRAQRDELRSQLEDVKQRRGEAANELANTPNHLAVDRAGLEQRISSLDKQIVSIEQQIAEANARVAQAAGVPGAVEEWLPPVNGRGGDDDAENFVAGAFLSAAFMVPVTWWLVRRSWKRRLKGAALPVAPEQQGELMDRVRNIEQALDAVATEVERVGEGQRFLTRVMTDNGAASAGSNGPRALGQGAAQPVEVAAREKVPQGAE